MAAPTSSLGAESPLTTPVHSEPSSPATWRGRKPKQITASRTEKGMMTEQLHDDLTCVNTCCVSTMCCVVWGVAAFIAYHHGVSRGLREVAPRCMYDLHVCNRAFTDLSKTCKKN